MVSPGTISKLFAGPLGLLDAQYAVADANVDVEDILVGLLVLGHFGIDTRTFFEERHNILHGIDSPTVILDSSCSIEGQVCRLTV